MLVCRCVSAERVWQKQITYENKMQSLFEFIHNSIRSNYQEQTNVTKSRIDKKMNYIIPIMIWIKQWAYKMWKWKSCMAWCMRWVAFGCVVYAILSAMSGNWMSIIYFYKIAWNFAFVVRAIYFDEMASKIVEQYQLTKAKCYSFLSTPALHPHPRTLCLFL